MAISPHLASHSNFLHAVCRILIVIRPILFAFLIALMQHFLHASSGMLSSVFCSAKMTITFIFSFYFCFFLSRVLTLHYPLHPLLTLNTIWLIRWLHTTIIVAFEWLPMHPILYKACYANDEGNVPKGVKPKAGCFFTGAKICILVLRFI